MPSLLSSDHYAGLDSTPRAAIKGKRILMVMIPDKLSDLVAKGEVTPGYYNPGNLFEEVHVVMTLDDAIEADSIQALAGGGRLFLYCMPMRRGWRAATLAGQPRLLDAWADTAVKLAERIRPALVRCHGNWWNAYCAVRIKQKLRIPFVVSLHTNPDTDVRGRTKGVKAWLWAQALRPVEREVLRHADAILPVYEAIVPYLKRMGAPNGWTVIHNAVNVQDAPKEDYRLHQPIRLLSVGRQVPGKDPEPIIRALAQVPDAELTLIGDGKYHRRLVETAEACGVQDRLIMRQAVPNAALCRMLPEFDLFVICSNYWELSKSLLEAMLAGLPTIMNRRIGPPVPELNDTLVRFVDGTADDYARAIQSLLEDDQQRERLGRSAAAHARASWSPKMMQAKVLAVYRQLMEVGNAE